MRLATSLRTLLVPAVLLAGACDETSSPIEPSAIEDGAAGPEAAPPEAVADPGSAGLLAPGRWADGYLLAGNPVTASYLPSAMQSYNASGGGMTLTKVPGTTGRYVARLTGLSALLGSRSTVHVSGYANGGATENTYCKPAAARLVRDSVEVRCFRAGSGTPANAAFTLMVTRDYDYRAFAFANQPTASGYAPAGNASWNPTGTIRIVRDDELPGEYEVRFTGLSKRQVDGALGHIQVNAVGTGKTQCFPMNWIVNLDVVVTVRCTTPSGARVDSKFNVLVALPSPHLAYVWADKPTEGSYTPLGYTSWNPVPEATTITRNGIGRYTVTWMDAGASIVDLGDVQVTGYGSNAQCKALQVRESSVDVQCYGADGAVKDSRFMVMLHS